MHNEHQLRSVHNYDPQSLHLVERDRTSYTIIKRVIDILIASLLLVLLSPLMLLIAVAIAIYSPGPVFFIQERVGGKQQYKGKHAYWKRTTFPCYKFRTMHVNTDPSIHREYIQAIIENDLEKMSAIQGGITKIRKLVKDPRITRPGKLLRKLSLDELPQLWNVLRGEMSLVGPRPAIPYEVEMYQPWHLRRLEALPGITGLQQVRARSTLDFDQQVQLDLQYIDNQSLLLDLKIMLITPLIIFSTRGAG